MQEQIMADKLVIKELVDRFCILTDEFDISEQMSLFDLG